MVVSELIDLHRESVSPDWVDYNGHMNVAYYMLVFDHATDVVLENIGLNQNHREVTGNSVFVAEAHLTYEREAMENDELRVTTQLLDTDEKRIHMFHRMYLIGNEVVIATNELMILSVNLTNRRVTPFAQSIKSKLHPIALAHTSLPFPEKAGRIIKIPHR